MLPTYAAAGDIVALLGVGCASGEASAGSRSRATRTMIPFLCAPPSCAAAGDIVAMFGVECASGDTFTDGAAKLAMTSMSVPEPVMTLAIAPKARDQSANFSKALNR